LYDGFHNLSISPLLLALIYASTACPSGAPMSVGRQSKVNCPSSSRASVKRSSSGSCKAETRSRCFCSSPRLRSEAAAIASPIAAAQFHPPAIFRRAWHIDRRGGRQRMIDASSSILKSSAACATSQSMFSISCASTCAISAGASAVRVLVIGRPDTTRDIHHEGALTFASIQTRIMPILFSALLESIARLGGLSCTGKGIPSLQRQAHEVSQLLI
jgi:hypothetical protein